VDVSDDDEEIFIMHNGYARKAVSNFRPSLKKRKEGHLSGCNCYVSAVFTDLKDYVRRYQWPVSMDRILNALDELRAIFEHVYSITNEDGSLWVVVNTFRRNHELIQLRSTSLVYAKT